MTYDEWLNDGNNIEMPKVYKDHHLNFGLAVWNYQQKAIDAFELIQDQSGESGQMKSLKARLLRLEAINKELAK